MRSFGQIFGFLLLLLLAGGTFLTGLNWGLPDHDADIYLFNGRLPWTGDQIMRLAGAWDEETSRGADIAMHPLPGQRAQPILLNDTDAKRAQIIRRYLLYSAQPDEMITFRSLSRMKPARLDFDPRLYQYGGFWVYPIGALLKLGSMAHLITLRTDLAFYLDNPAAFARFYLVARAYSAVWGLIGVLVVYSIGREWTGRFSTGITAAAIYFSMPVVIDLAHEAKPHLAGCVLILLTLLCGLKYARSGSRRWWLLAGVCAGAATAMVLTGYVAFTILAVMTLLRPISWKNRFRVAASSVLIGLLLVGISDPYLPYNLLFNRQVLHSNVGNYGSFYQPHLSWTGICFAAKSIVEGASPGPVLIGVLGIITILLSIRKNRMIAALMAAPALLVLAQFVLLAEGRTAEYARFALLLDVMLGLCAAVLIDQLRFSARERGLASALLIVSTLFFGIRYDLNFVGDNRPDSTRRIAAEKVESLVPRAKVLDTWAEPAPYCMPPVDLFHWQIVLLPKDWGVVGDNVVSVRPVDVPSTPQNPPRASSPISWANKPFQIQLESRVK